MLYWKKKYLEVPLIDDLISEKYDTSEQIGTRWYIAKPLHYYGILEIKRRIIHAWLVLIGKAQCYRYGRDLKK